MPDVRPVAVLVSDIHLTLNPPACRDCSQEEWMGIQAKYLSQILNIATRLENESSRVKFICAGDIFDRWNPPPELIRFALEWLPNGMLCVPGQHDLPHHRIENMHQSGYGVLAYADKIVDLSNCPDRCWSARPLHVHGIGWGQEIKKPSADRTGLNIAVVHRYVWIDAFGYPGAPETAKLSSMAKELKGYDVAVFGDNHQGFIAEARDCVVCNCGGFIRRKSDEIDRVPSVGILFSDGTVQRRKLDTSIDRFHKDAKKRERKDDIDMRELVKELKGLGEHGLDFRFAVKNYLDEHKVDKETRAIIMTAMESEQ